MKKVILIATAVLYASIMFTGCGKNESSTKSIAQLHKENGVPVKVLTVAKESFSVNHTFHAVLTGIKESTASAMVADKVEKINYSVRDHVEKDAVVMTFPTDNPSAQYFQSKVAYEHAESTLNRMKNLYEKGGISLQDYENAQTQFKVTEANWEAVRQTVKVKAPLSGIISSINVQGTDNVNPGDVLFKVSQTHKLKAKLWISDDQFGDVSIGNEATASWRGINLKGCVTQVDISLNTRKQAFGVLVEFDNPDQRINSGVNAEIHLLAKSDNASVIVERKNIINEEGDYFVFIAKDDVALKQKVTLGKQQDVNVEILEGLNPGDLLITEGQMLLEDSIKIRVMN